MKFLLILSAISFSAWSAGFDRQVWSDGDDHYLFNLDPSTNILIALNCMNNTMTLEKSKCEAAKVIREKKLVKIPAGSASGGKNPGAVICKLGLKKKIKILKDLKNNENSFCLFEDGSMISAINLQVLVKE